MNEKALALLNKRDGGLLLNELNDKTGLAFLHVASATGLLVRPAAAAFVYLYCPHT
jgi:hypothetical protein